MTSGSTRSGWRLSLQAWLGLLALGLLLWLTITHAGMLMEILWVLFGALLLSIAIHPVVSTLARWRIPRAVTILGVYVILGLLLALLGSLIAPAISEEINTLQNSGPEFIQATISRIAKTPLLSQVIPSTDVLAQNLIQRMDLLVRTTVGAVASLGGMALDVLVMLILAFFISTDASLGKRLLNDWLPASDRALVDHLWKRLRHRLTRWFWAQAGIALYFIVTFSAGLTLLGVPFAFTIGLVGGILEIIPYLGGAVAVFLAMLSALTVQPLLAVWVFVLYLVVTELESHVIAPAFYGRAIGLHPAVVLVALLVGVKAGGVVGVLFAVPVAVVLAALLGEAHTLWQTTETGTLGKAGASHEPEEGAPHEPEPSPTS
jgi:predicted PurR-regulated permease PerM